MYSLINLPEYSRVCLKKIYWLQVDATTVRALCDCDVYPDTCIEVEMTLAQALELTSDRHTRRNIAEILPNASKEVREIFITGTTPAEWDELFGKGAKPAAAYGCYKPQDEEAE